MNYLLYSAPATFCMIHHLNQYTVIIIIIINQRFNISFDCLLDASDDRQTNHGPTIYPETQTDYNRLNSYLATNSCFWSWRPLWCWAVDAPTRRPPTQTCSCQLRCLRAVHQIMGWDDTSQLVSTFVLSHVDICNATLTGLPAATLCPFHRVTNAAVRTVLDLRPRFLQPCTEICHCNRAYSSNSSNTSVAGRTSTGTTWRDYWRPSPTNLLT
jgi:hypothetical protein